MLNEVLQSITSDVTTGLFQAGGAILLCVAVILVCRRFAVHVEREATISIMRGLAQMVLVGVVLALLLRGSVLVGALILLLMVVAAASPLRGACRALPIRSCCRSGPSSPERASSSPLCSPAARSNRTSPCWSRSAA